MLVASNKIIQQLTRIWDGIDYPFFIYNNQELNFSQIASQNPIDLSLIKKGDVVAIIGDFNPSSILTFLRLIDLGAIVVPLTIETAREHEYFFETALVNFVIKDNLVSFLSNNKKHELIDSLRAKNHAGLVLFSTGTTGRPKAILHDLTLFLKRFETPRPSLRTINFLLFDHIGGVNTLFHTLFNKGVVVATKSRAINDVLDSCRNFNVEVLPTTPTFLRLMLMSGAIPDKIPSSLKIITYGTESMDQRTLNDLCNLLPKVDFRQTYGMSELGIVRVKSKARDSLFMKIGGENVQTRVVNDVLQIHSESRMLGYLNALSPFNDEGWYDTKDIVEVKDGYYKITGRISEVINVGGLKFMASDIERIALTFPNVLLVKAIAKQNPITGQHVELIVQPTIKNGVNKDSLMIFLMKNLESHMVPKRVKIDTVNVGHRFKKY
jgi:long-chain acyl-CoA synthetase